MAKKKTVFEMGEFILHFFVHTNVIKIRKNFQIFIFKSQVLHS